MCRLINATALGEKLEALMQKYAAMGKPNVAQDYNFVMTVIECAPTVDAVEVVRCKDCKSWKNGDCYRQELTRPDDFCSYGERRKEK